MATSVLGGTGRSGSDLATCTSAPNKLALVAPGVDSGVPRSRKRGGLGWYYRGEYTLAEREVRDGLDRRHSSPFPCIRN
jgi:hypothetical protein